MPCKEKGQLKLVVRCHYNLFPIKSIINLIFHYVTAKKLIKEKNTLFNFLKVLSQRILLTSQVNIGVNKAQLKKNQMHI